MTTLTKAQPRQETKLETIERLVRRKRGASVRELAEATSWKDHSLTGGLSRVRKTGTLSIRKETDPKRGTVFFGTPAGDDTGGHVKA